MPDTVLMTFSWSRTRQQLAQNPRWVKVQLSILSGILLAAVFPKTNLHWLAWFALIPLFFVLLQPLSMAEAFGYTFLFGMVHYALLLYWVVEVIHKYGYVSQPLAILFYLGFAAFNGLFLAVFGWLARRILRQNYLFLGRFLPTGFQISILNSLLVAALWVAMEFWHTYMFTGFPWCLLGYALITHAGIMQISPVTGIYGVSFLVCAMNLLLAHALFQKKRALFWGTSLLLALLLTGDFCFQAWLNHSSSGLNQRTTPGSSTEHRVAILQMNIPQDTEWTQEVLDLWLQQLDKMLQQSQSEIAVMPENPAPFYYPGDRDFTERLNSMVDRSGSTVIAGVVMSHPDQQGRMGVYNSAATLAPSGHLLAEYDKQHLVPFGEYIPFRKYLAFLGKLTSEISDFTPGHQLTLSGIQSNRAAVFICYEVIFPNLVRQFTRQGAGVLINITNDGWYGSSAAPYQHFEMARARAIENRRYVIRAANTGISAIIDPYGRVMERSALNQQIVMHGLFEYRNDQTFYVLHGDLFAWLCTIVSVGFLIFLVVRKTGK
jgi:apolipoprotein N-acyltransferase